MTAQITTIKNAVKTKLDTLKTAGTLGTVIVDDFKTDPTIGLKHNIAAYPAAIMASPSVESAYETNMDNLRTHIFEIVIVQKGENISTTSNIEELMEALLNAFDNDPTLGGAANGAVDPVVSSPEPVTTVDGTFIVFTVTIKARALFTRT